MRNLLFLISIFLGCVEVSAQLKVFANGRVGVAYTLDSVQAKLSIGNRDYATSRLSHVHRFALMLYRE